MLATLALALIAHASIERPAIPVRVALVDPNGKDVTAQACDPNSRFEVPLIKWVADATSQPAGRVGVGVPFAVVPAGEGTWSVGLAQPIQQVAPVPTVEGVLAPGWAYVGDPCPAIEIPADATAEQLVPVLVARTRTVELTFALPDGATARGDFGASGLILPESGLATHFATVIHGPQTQVLDSSKLQLPPGRHTLWGVARHRNPQGSKFWAREEFEVTEAEFQRVAIRYRTGVTITGRMTRASGQAVALNSQVLLSVPDSRKFTGRAPQFLQSTLWSASFRDDGRFELQGMPPGFELTAPNHRGPEGPTRFRVPEAGGDVGTIVLR